MISRLKFQQSKKLRFSLSTLVATEEFPFKVVLTPKPALKPIFTSIKLTSGIQTISREYNSSIVSLKFAIIGGSRAEAQNQKGAAHFLSTAAFSGTRESSGLKLVHLLENIGATFNSSSDKEKIIYDVKVLPDKVEEAIKLVMSAIGSPPHDSYVLDELKPTTELDYAEFKSNHSSQLKELVHEAAYGEASPLGSSIFAPCLNKLSINDVITYRATHFVQSNIIIIGDGIAHDRLRSIIERESSWIPKGSVNPTASLTPSPYLGGDVKVRTDLDTSHIALAFPVPSGEAAKPYIILSALIGSKIASHKICGSSFISSFGGLSGGLFGVHVVGPAPIAVGYLEGLVAELKSIAKTCPEIDALKKKVTLNNFLALEGENTTSALLTAHLQGVDPHVAADVRSVTASSVSNAAITILKSIPSYAVLGATAGTPSFTTIIKMLK